MKHIFLSPHLDDANLSAGEYILQLRKRREQTLVITLFTTFGKKKPLGPAKKYLNDSGFNDPLAFSKERVGEDKRAMQILDTQFVRLRFVDALYRTHSGKKRQKSFYIYPSFESLRSGKINPVELPLIKTLADTISKYIFKDDILYAPMGIGGHVDHFIANAVLTLFPNRHFYWIDQPYILRNLEEISSKYLHSFTVVSTERKIFALLQYISQIPLLYPEGIRLMEEQFFVDRG